MRTESVDDQSEETVGTGDPAGLFASAERHLNESVLLLREAGYQEMIARGLLARAALWRVKAELGVSTGSSCGGEEVEQFKPAEMVDDTLAKAKKDLAEAESIAECGSMLLCQIDAVIERCRLQMARASLGLARDDWAEGDGYEAARESLERAKQLIKQTEKAHDPHVPDWDEWEPPEYVGVFKKGEIVGYHRRDAEIEQLEKALGGKW